MDYDYSYNYSAGEDPVSDIISLALVILLLVSYWRMFQKAGQPGWKAIVPLYNGYTLTSLVFSSGWFFLLAIVPIANIVFYCMLCTRLAKAYGKGTGFGVLTIFFPYVCFPILAFSSTSFYTGNPALGGGYGYNGYNNGYNNMGGYPQQGYDPYQQNNGYGMPNNNYDPNNYYGQATPSGTPMQNYDQNAYGQNNYGQNNYGQNNFNQNNNGF